MSARWYSSSRLVLLGSLFELALGVVAVTLGAAIGRDPMSLLSFTMREIILGGAATIPPVVLFLLFLSSSREKPARIRRYLLRLLHPLLAGMTPIRAAVLSLAAGLGEELLFRGLMQAALAVAIGPFPALVASSLLFGAIHWITPLYALYATLFGLYLGALFMLTGSLAAPILVHAIYDGVALLALARHTDNARGETNCETRYI
jgi:uncharacterized protein